MINVSVVIPSYNYGSHLLQAITSLSDQLQPGDEVIVVDDGSTDDTRDQLGPLIQSNKVRYYFQQNSGVSSARNQGVQLAENNYLYFLDADDRVLENGLALLRTMVDKHPEAAMVFGGHESVTSDGRRRVHRQQVIGNNSQDNFIDYVIRRKFSIANGGTALIKREIALCYPFPLGLRVSEDFCVFAWILANHQCASFAQPVVAIYKHEGSLREQLDLYEQAVEILPSVLFSADHVPETLHEYKQVFRCNRMLSLFRARYLAGEKSSAIVMYKQAIQCRPLNIFKWSYFRKFVRLVLS
jgi:glycosyltransferase involved in cell wall biosynthesis